MQIYYYRAKKGAGEIIEGRIEAGSEREAIEKLSQKGYLPLTLREDTACVEKDAPVLIKKAGRVRAREVTVFSRQLASLLKSGVAILAALSIIREQSENASFQEVLSFIHKGIKEGATFSSVLAQYPKVFPNLYVAMVRAGEDSGTLPEALFRIADYRAKQEEILSRLRMALAYPALMGVVGVATVVFMLTFVMPRMMGIFENMGQNLPLPTRALIFISNLLRQNWYWIALIGAAVYFSARKQLKSEKAKMSASIFILGLPLFGKLILKAELARFCSTMELLLKNGISILQAIKIAVPVLENEALKKQLLQSCSDLEQGGSFGKSLKGAKFFPLFLSNLISVGEESGRLNEALGEAAGAYERDTDEAIRIMSALIEPLMILVMGIIVGFIVVAMLLPIFEISLISG